MLLFSCGSNTETAAIKIKPLHPYSASPFDYHLNEKKEKSFIIKFYFIEGACKATDELSKQVDKFITKFIESDTDFIHFGGYHLRFYRKTKVINENFKEQIDGRISYSLLDDYDKDLLFEYAWSAKNFMGCTYYYNSKVIKTVYNKEGNILKRDSGPGPKNPFSSSTQQTLVESQAGVKFTNTAIKRYLNSSRTVNKSDLKNAIQTKAYPDPQGSSASAYYSRIIRNGKPYNLKVIYDKKTNTIFHFHYSRQALGPLSKISK